MAQLSQYILALLMLISAIPIGNLLAKVTKEELKIGRVYFKWIIIISAFFTLVSLVLMRDDLLFTFLFIIILTSKSFFYKSKEKSKKK